MVSGRRRIGWIFGLVLAFVAFSSRPAHAIVGGQVDNFQDGTIQGWVTGPIAPLPTNIATGGPTGVGDRYLRVEPATHLATFNATQWSGDYTSAGVLDVGVDFMNPNATVAEMRLVMFGPAGGRWTSIGSVLVPTDSLWHHHTFSLRQSDLTLVFGSDSYTDTMAGALQLMFRHDNAPSRGPGGTPYTGSIGIDNVTAIAVPEPASAGLFALATLAAAVPRRRRR